MIPSVELIDLEAGEVYQRGLVIDSQLNGETVRTLVSVSKGIGD